MNSIPDIEHKQKRLKTLKGMVGSIIDMGGGCKLCSRFEPDKCACGGTGIEPELIEVKPNHYARINKKILQ